MVIPADRTRDVEATAHARDALRLTRGIAATWWYTFAAVVFYAVVLVFVWTSTLLSAHETLAPAALVGVGGLVWVLVLVALLVDYRNRAPDSQPRRRRRALTSILLAITYGIVAGLLSGFWLFAVLPILVVLVLFDWQPGIRRRVVLAATVLLGILLFIDARLTFPAIGASWWVIGTYCVLLPGVIVFSLWWWDVLVLLDRARASEARLGATQERLRVATDVHDLQGHHLQVVALQLQLTERLLATDAEEALRHLQAARASVDEARQGTRDLATRFRSVPLSSELANAVDLLRAAGTDASASVHPDGDRAPASVLAPIIRETTTNVLRHGGGERARLSLSRTPTTWRFEISNDAAAAVPGATGGSGLKGIERRVTEAGGTFEVQRGAKSFALLVTVPAPDDGAR